MCNENTSSFTEEQEPGCQNPTVGDQQSDSIDQSLCKLVLYVSAYYPPNLPIVLSLGHGNKIHSFWSPPTLKICAMSCFFNEFKGHHACAVLPVISWYCLLLDLTPDGFAMELFKYHPPAPVFLPLQGAATQSWSGVSNQAVFKACSVSARVGVPAFSDVNRVCHGTAQDSEL